MFNTFQSTESSGAMAMHRANQKRMATQRRKAEKKRLRIEQENREIKQQIKQHTIVIQLKIQLKEAQDIVGHLRIDSRKTLKQLYNMIKDRFPSPKLGLIPKIYSGKIKLSDKKNETLTIADYFNIKEKQLEGWAAARVAGTMEHQFPEQAKHIAGQSLTLLIIYERKMPARFGSKKKK